MKDSCNIIGLIWLIEATPNVLDPSTEAMTVVQQSEKEFLKIKIKRN